MFLHHPDLLLTNVRDHHNQLIADADQRRLLSAARRHRRDRARARAAAATAARAEATGTVVPCGPAVAAPVR